LEEYKNNLPVSVSIYTNFVTKFPTIGMLSIMTECNLLWDGGIGAWLRNAALRLQLRVEKATKKFPPDVRPCDDFKTKGTKGMNVVWCRANNSCIEERVGAKMRKRR
jgi:hypothetical protein